MSDAFHYLSLSLTNVRAFGGRQTLDFSKGGKPARWCVILGENGVGKTTIMQSLAVMRPSPSFGDSQQAQEDGAEAAPPEWIEPEFAEYENPQIKRFARRGAVVETLFEAHLMSEDRTEVQLGYKIVTSDNQLKSADALPHQFTLASRGPLVIAYSAYRHAGVGNLSSVEDVSPTAGLFDERIALVDPDEVIERLDYAILNANRDGDALAKARWEGVVRSMTEVIAALIPDCAPNGIQINGPKVPGTTGRSGIHVQTPSGLMPLADLSLGYQTMVAWTVDLAWRLFTHFPKSTNPFQESAVVLIDEVDLHLHPVWQRSVRERLLQHFPHIQFIVSTHSPVTAQESIFAGDPLAIVRWDGDHAVIIQNPVESRAARLDEVATEIFDLETSQASRVEKLLIQRRNLIRQRELTPEQKDLLIELNALAHEVHSGLARTEELDRIMSKVAAVPAQ